MKLLKFYSIKCMIFIVLLYVMEIHCQGHHSLEPVSGSLFHDSSKIDMLLAKIHELNDRLIKSERITSELLQKLGWRLDRVIDVQEEQSKFMDTLKNTNLHSKDPMILKNNNRDLNQMQHEIQTILSATTASYSSCEEALSYNYHSGAYFLRIASSKLLGFRVFCLRDPKSSNGKPWTVIMRRQEDSKTPMDFKKDWQAYKEGFGDAHSDYWLGLENIFALTNSTKHELWIQSINKKGESRDSHHDDFKIADASKNFAIYSLGRNFGGQAMKNCVNVPFNTIDRGNTNYAESNGGAGFWGPYALNYNRQFYGEKNKVRIGILLNETEVIHVHLAIRPKSP